MIIKILYYQLIPIIQNINYIFLNILDIKNNLVYWATNVKKYFTWNQYIIKNSSPLYTSDCVYFANHREVMDFPIDAYLTCGKAAFISRYFILFGAPFTGLLTLFSNSVFYFRRHKNINKSQFIIWCNTRLRNSDYKSLIIYPEGTRRLSNDVTNIRDGGIMYSYEYKKPIQIIITKNKEYILSVKTFTGQNNVDCFTYISKPLYPDNYVTYIDYRTSIVEEWNKCWKIVYENEYTSDMCDLYKPIKYDIPVGTISHIRIFFMRFVFACLCYFVYHYFQSFCNFF